MKMKEVCSRTGLTERAVRFYTELGLVCPEESASRGRTYYEYSAEDTQRLTEIAALRSMDFSVKDIQAMYEGGSPDALLSAHCSRLRQEAEVSQSRLLLLEQMLPQRFENASALAKFILRQANPSVDIASADAAPNFGRLDGLTREEREQLTRQSSQALLGIKTRRRKLTMLMGILCCAVLIVGAAVWIYLADQHSPLSMITTITSVEFTSKTQTATEDQNELQVQIRPLGSQEDWPAQFTALFENTADGYALWNSLFLNREYAMVTLTVEIPRGEAAKLGLLDSSASFLNAYQTIQTVFSDDTLARKYIRVVNIQAES